MDRRLGRPLPYQLPNPTQASPKAPEGFNPKTICGISYPFGQLFLTLGQIPTRYSAVRRSPTFYTKFLNNIFSFNQKLPEFSVKLAAARLACVRHAASIHPEPGSNSPLKSTLYQSIKALQKYKLTMILHNQIVKVHLKSD